MAKEKEPEKIEITREEILALDKRIADFVLTRDDAILLGKTFHGYIWFMNKLMQITTTMHKLRKAVFGDKTEKSKASRSRKNKGLASNDASAVFPPAPSMNDKVEAEKLSSMNNLGALTQRAVKGHGRMGVEAYTPDEIISVNHASLKAGDPCPLLCGGRLYEMKHPGIVIRIKGQPCAHVIRYEFGKLRCALCQAVFIAEAPGDFPLQKYDAHFKANLVVQKYFMASPFYRQERYQKLLGVPLPDSTQWDLVESVADCAYPVLNVLEQMAANGTHLNHDDTHVKILDVIRANQLEPDKKRKGTFTTCILAQSSEHKICLYYSGTQHGGENVARVLGKRDPSLPPVIRMCDALSANVPVALKTILCHCLVHGRRKFTDIEAFFPEECGYVIEQLAQVYKHDAQAKEQQMTADQRLAHHQEYSAPVMEALKVWMQAQFDERKVEPNSALGHSIRYMQKHWTALTRFLSVSGAHLDNNVVERALKLAICTRKNAMFHRSLHGAFVAGLLLSLIATCELGGKNPVHYLIALQVHKSEVFKSPHLWLPWNYELTLTGLQEKAA